MKQEGFPEQVLSLVKKPECNSEDEQEIAEGTDEISVAIQSASAATEGPGTYIILPKEGRSEKVTNFFRIIDQRRARTQRAKRTSHRYAMLRISCLLAQVIFSAERKRVVRANPPVSSITTFPKEVPVDFIEPNYWNNEMTVAEKYRIIKTGIKIALPPAGYLEPARWKEWKTLSDDEFMAKFGNTELEKYDMPTKEELDMLEKYATTFEDKTTEEEGEEEEGEDA